MAAPPGFRFTSRHLAKLSFRSTSPPPSPWPPPAPTNGTSSSYSNGSGGCRPSTRCATTPGAKHGLHLSRPAQRQGRSSDGRLRPELLDLLRSNGPHSDRGNACHLGLRGDELPFRVNAR